MEAMWGLTLTPGYDPQLTCMAHLWEVSHRLGLGQCMTVHTCFDSRVVSTRGMGVVR
jgi:hypothetical protein